VKMW